MQNMMVAMATILRAVCRSDHDLSDDIKCALVFMLLSNLVVLSRFSIFILIRNVVIIKYLLCDVVYTSRD